METLIIDERSLQPLNMNQTSHKKVHSPSSKDKSSVSVSNQHMGKVQSETRQPGQVSRSRREKLGPLATILIHDWQDDDNQLSAIQSRLAKSNSMVTQWRAATSTETPFQTLSESKKEASHKPSRFFGSINEFSGEVSKPGETNNYEPFKLISPLKRAGRQAGRNFNPKNLSEERSQIHGSFSSLHTQEKSLKNSSEGKKLGVIVLKQSPLVFDKLEKIPNSMREFAKKYNLLWRPGFCEQKSASYLKETNTNHLTMTERNSPSIMRAKYRLKIKTSLKVPKVRPLNIADVSTVEPKKSKLRQIVSSNIRGSIAQGRDSTRIRRTAQPLSLADMLKYQNSKVK